MQHVTWICGMCMWMWAVHLITDDVCVYRVDFTTACSSFRKWWNLFIWFDICGFAHVRMCLYVFIFRPMASAQSSRHLSRQVGRFFEEHQTQTSFPSAGPTAFGTLCAKLVSLKSRKSWNVFWPRQILGRRCLSVKFQKQPRSVRWCTICLLRKLYASLSYQRQFPSERAKHRRIIHNACEECTQKDLLW